MLQKQLFWFTNYKSVIFHFTLSFCSPLSFSPLCLPFVSPVVSPRCVSPWCLPWCPRGGDPNATSRGERFHGGGLWTHQSYPKTSELSQDRRQNIPSWDSSDVFPGGFALYFFLNIKLPFWDIDGATPTHSPKSGCKCPHRWRNSLISPDIHQPT